MIGPVPLRATDRRGLDELAPLLRRAVGLDARTVARLQLTGSVATVLVRLPFGVLVSRGVAVGADGVDAVAAGRDESPTAGPAEGLVPVRDLTVGAAELLDWLDADDPSTAPPPSRDTEWRGGLPPGAGWRRVDTVPDTVIRPLVRQGALTLKAAAAREGAPDAQPRQVTADALLDSVVLQVSDASDPTGADAPLTLRAVSALTRMGFLPRGGSVHVDIAGRWLRLAAAFGSVYQERPGSGLDGLTVVGAP